MDHVDAEWSEVPLSRLALGCELLGGADWGAVDQDAAIDAVRAAVDAGVTVFDTADVYGLGRSEEVLSQALGRHRNDVVIITKGGVTWDDSVGSTRPRTSRNLSADYLRSAVHSSLRRLGVERIPLYLAHWPDGRHAAEDVVATLQALRDDGLVAAFGLSNFAIDDLARSGVLSAIDAVEVEHSLISSRTPGLLVARRHPVVSFAYGSLAQGLLTGKYPPGHEFPADDRRHRLPHFSNDTTERDVLLATLAEVAEVSGRSRAQVALRWALDSGPDCIVVGARNRRQVADNLASLDAPLDPAVVPRLDAAALPSGPE